VIYVTDTHPLIFAGTQKYSRLGRKARRIFRDVDAGRNVIVIPVTVFEEIMRLAEKGLATLKGPFHRWAEEIGKAPNFQVQPYTLEILLAGAELPSIRDPADRAIVATARHLGYPLITADEQIQEGGWVETVWD
jgi:PIN domain nuclease of toxin-antitoxin system